MKFKVPDRLRLALSEKYLNLAESLPKFQRGFIAYLQGTRESQRQQSELAYEHSRAPHNESLEFLAFRLIEVYTIEQVDQLRKAILSYFPEIDSELGRKPFSKDLQYQAENVFGRAWWNLGFAVRDTGRRLFAGRVCHMEALSPEVDYIKIGLSKISPSLFAVTLDVCLDPCVNEKLLALHNRRYLPEVRLHSLVPTGIRGYGTSSNTADSMMAKAVVDWFQDLQRNVEARFESLTCGCFSSRSIEKTVRLPSTKVFVIKGTPPIADVESLEEWTDESRRWWMSFGFDLSPFELYTDGTLMFSMNEDHPPSSPSSYSLVALWDTYVRSVDARPFGNNEKLAVVDGLLDVLGPMLPAFAILEFLKYPQRHIGELRLSVFHTLRSRRFSRLRLRRFIRLSDEILLSSFSLERLVTELDLERHWFAHDLEKLGELKRVYRSADTEIEDLGTSLAKAIKFRADLLQKHTAFIGDWFSQYLNLRNIDSTFILAIVVLIAALIEIIGIKQIQEFIKSLAEMIRGFVT